MAPTAGATSAAASTAEQRIENLRNRIENVLRARKARFDAAAANLVKRQARVNVLADKVEALGGDVSQVRTMLQECTRLMEQTRTQEQVCVEAFKAIPEATDKGAAFQAAKAQGREAVALMKQTRTQLREATRTLAQIADGLTAPEE
ncbi:MAG: hypothetical protein CVT59_06360 [Actinobacteria bacterium HGW-Actinobacteria-1]|nr:MAG: hypothetical protein CVT59_06360 [Actinobacteria bacterium HGW-Actinobacteria-1]